MNLQKYNVRTDIATEAVQEKSYNYIQELIEDDYDYGKVKVKRTVVSENLASEMEKRAGVYYLVDTSETNAHDTDDLNLIKNVLSEIIKKLLNEEGITTNSKGLIVGLGNVNVTPDSLGPLVMDNVIVTRHMFLLNPEEVSKGISNVCAIAPGVMGNTGIETMDIINAIIEKVGVDYVIVVDALSARSIKRVNKSIQLTNSGISPGSGVGNKRKELSKETLGIPVIAIGVPTVVDAVTIASDAIDYILKYFNAKLTDEETPSDALVINEKVDLENEQLPNHEYKKELLGQFGVLTEEQKISLIESVLTPNGLNMMVTPKEVDIDIEDFSTVISSAIDRALHTIVN